MNSKKDLVAEIIKCVKGILAAYGRYERLTALKKLPKVAFWSNAELEQHLINPEISSELANLLTVYESYPYDVMFENREKALTRFPVLIPVIRSCFW